MRLLSIFQDILHDIDEFNLKLSNNNKHSQMPKTIQFLEINALLMQDEEDKRQ